MTDDTLQDVAARWDDNADQWAHDVRNGYDTYRELFTFPAFIDFLPPLAGLDVIDFGCGEGTNTRLFAQMGARMTGIDLSERMIGHARKAEEENPLGIAYKVASYSADTGFAEGSFDAVVSTMALMDGPDFEGAMRQAFRLTRPGGFLAFSVLHPCFITPGLAWQRNETGIATALCVSRYFDHASFTEEWRFGSRPADEEVKLFAVPRFPRTMSDYLNAIAAAGFRIRKIGEPQPSSEICEASPRFARWRDLAAFLLLVMAERP
ncbi:2-polyprenyl-3-methyl-5-hydroxy-6-metoxy-1,4-benzoquinol methylase [Rhizobium sp. BK529]|uniref:class I SAM-dependent methyltransferase n=1 Tax=unclassified Rhizobium TaxID=2613769 RepID=UPI001043A26B|nr:MULTISPECIES: class I SAM-dependent methyltransferase [unclassified Rhizobium]MBB3590497.1 2-polyprenyl-3-methyl-5-hydroxy-6-metoxy-1,4-benzoquinol methylase [Rhizobium sp. BK529]TCS05186.1 methyltransferase family protein [Rhizobium sp. BK418]